MLSRVIYNIRYTDDNVIYRNRLRNVKGQAFKIQIEIKISAICDDQ